MYLDGFILPLPIKNTDAYTTMATDAGKVWTEHGAVSYQEFLLDPTDPVPEFSMSFPQLVQPKDGETVVFSFVLYKDRAHRDEVVSKVMSDPRMLAFMEKGEMPFDDKRMVYGGFVPLVELSKA